MKVFWPKKMIINVSYDSMNTFPYYYYSCGEKYIAPCIKGKLILLPDLEGSGVDALNPVIISETEPINEGDWCLSNKENGRILFKNETIRAKKSDCKVLAKKHNFTPKQLQAIIDGNIKNNDEIIVECSILKKETFKFTKKSVNVIYPIRIYRSEEIKEYRKKDFKTYNRKEVLDILNRAIRLSRVQK